MIIKLVLEKSENWNAILSHETKMETMHISRLLIPCKVKTLRLQSESKKENIVPLEKSETDIPATLSPLTGFEINKKAFII